MQNSDLSDYFGKFIDSLHVHIFCQRVHDKERIMPRSKGR